MKDNKKTRIILWGFIIVLFVAFAYVYADNPFQKEYNDNNNLALAGLVFPTSLLLFELLLKKTRIKREISILSAFGFSIVFYLIFV